ncbi:DUF2238 domain-containing protein [Paenibacillus hodogayensis]|uniref:DUF2238 domain-containing protein n=1 Tax=Paenibacillus hodogayensis TaxID=279208 RepID=A0ABV5W426_9BACL
MNRYPPEYRPGLFPSGGSPPFRDNGWLQLLVGAFVLYWAFMALWPVQRSLWIAENVLLVCLAAALVWTYRWFRFSNRSYLFIVLFLSLHTYAAHYSYEANPLDAWLKAVFHFQRSYYDRIVHFAFGLFWIYPFAELYARLTGRRGVWLFLVPLAAVLGLSALFEIVEMTAASWSGQGQNSEQFLGMQGDLFDTQKDMMVALFGALIALGLLVWSVWNRKKAGV